MKHGPTTTVLLLTVLGGFCLIDAGAALARSVPREGDVFARRYRGADEVDDDRHDSGSGRDDSASSGGGGNQSDGGGTGGGKGHDDPKKKSGDTNKDDHDDRFAK